MSVNIIFSHIYDELLLNGIGQIENQLATPRHPLKISGRQDELNVIQVLKIETGVSEMSPLSSSILFGSENMKFTEVKTCICEMKLKRYGYKCEILHASMKWCKPTI